MRATLDDTPDRVYPISVVSLARHDRGLCESRANDAASADSDAVPAGHGAVIFS
jgi:hypothetical protein